MSIKHSFVSTQPQGGDSSKVSKNEWNADHVIADVWTPTPLSANTTLDATYEHVKVNGGSGSAVVITLPDATTFTKPLTIKRDDTGTTPVEIHCYDSQTIDGDAIYYLVNQRQYVTVSPDGANWQIKANN